jgi:hypothetical protein
MKTQKSLLLSATMAAATVTAATLATLPAQAMGLNGSISFGGTPVFGKPNQINPSQDTLGFKNVQVTESSGDFENGNFSSPAPIFETLKLAIDSSTINGKSAYYNFGNTQTFINFGQQDLGGGLKNLTFDLDAGQVFRSSNGGNIMEFGKALTGKFNYGSSTIATGSFSASKIFNSTSFQMTLEARSVPEPLTILGTGVALGFGAMFKKRAANRNKN